SLEVLKHMRQELSINDEEHRTILTALKIEDPDLLDPHKQLTRENRLRIESYRQALELVYLELVETGTPLRQALQLKKNQIRALKQEYTITAEEEAQVLAALFNETSALVHTAETQLEQLQVLAARYHALSQPLTNGQAATYGLLCSSVQQQQHLLCIRLLSILEILGEVPDASRIAAAVGVLAANVIPDILLADGEASRWEERLRPPILALLRQTGDTSVVSERPATAQEVLNELLQELEPLTQAAALHALYQLDAQQGAQQARQLLSADRPLHWLVRETATNLLDPEKVQTPAPALTLIARITGLAPTQQQFQQSVVRVGRDHDNNDIVLLDTRVSPQHAVFYLDDQGVSIRDLGSTNGLQIGSKLLRNDQLRLNQGDMIRFSRAVEPVAITVNWEMRPLLEDQPPQVLSTLEKLLCLFESSFFRQLKPDALIELARDAQVRFYKKGEEVCRVGEPADELLMLTAGKAQACVKRGNSVQIVGTILPGQTIGELGVLTRSNRSATVVTTAQKTQILAIDANKLEALLGQDSGLVRDLLLMVSSRLQNTLSQISDSKAN
ncbi:MAG TPA: FHA domain-containing protein, partial [Candidatus Caenarcaniphilales bacterium]